VKPAPQTGADAEQGKAGVRPATRDLIDEGKASSVARVRRAAEKAQAALDHLAAVIDETREAEAAKRAAEAEKAAARRKVAELEAQLAAAKAALRGKPAPTAAPTGDAKAIRAWAAANGVECPTRGKVPAAVVEAYRAAVAA
jgi:ATPase subunit of ABC transporter with duplicated ATPase domains